MKRLALVKPTELAQLAQLSEQHEDVMRQLALEPSAAPQAPVIGPRELQIEARQLRQEALKLLEALKQEIEQL